MMSIFTDSDVSNHDEVQRIYVTDLVNIVFNWIWEAMWRERGGFGTARVWRVSIMGSRLGQRKWCGWVLGGWSVEV